MAKYSEKRRKQVLDFIASFEPPKQIAMDGAISAAQRKFKITRATIYKWIAAAGKDWIYQQCN